MRIVVLVKEVPDTYGDRKLDLGTGLADRAASERVLDEIGERALEVALAYKDSAGAEVTALSMGPADASGSIRKALQVGGDAAVQVVDEDLVGADLGLTAEVLAAAIRRAEFDLVIAGNSSTDGSGGLLPAMVAELLGVASLTYLSEVTIAEGAVSGTRTVDAGVQRVSASLPAVVSVTEALPDLRMTNFKGIMAAKKKPFETIALADLGVVAWDGTVPRAIIAEVAETQPRGAGVKIVDEGDAADKLADFLASNRLI